MNQDQVQKIKNGRLLELIRVRPAMWVGRRSLSAVSDFLKGWGVALQVYDIKREAELPNDFHDWVAYRLGFYESTSGYRNMILKRVPDESAALDRFFQLLDEHHNRKPHVVARLLGYKGDRLRQICRDRVLPQGVGSSYPNLNLVSYTDDPGFFVMFDDEESKPAIHGRFFPTLQSFGLRFAVDTG